MKQKKIILIFSLLILLSCNDSKLKNPEMTAGEKEIASSVCSDACKAVTKTEDLTCRLTSPELRRRKETVISSLKQKILEKKELRNGYAFKFKGTDEILDELTEFIKTERSCCAFFTFGLSVSGDKNEAWLEMTGAEGTKDFITAELGF